MRSALLRLSMIGAGAIGAVSTCAIAQTSDSQSIIDALKPKPPAAALTRSLTRKDANGDEQYLRSLPTRGIRIEQRRKIDEIVAREKLPQIDIEINFDYGSAQIRSSSLGALHNLGEALANKELADCRFTLNGHTDAMGSESYNQQLSDRRAAAVRDYLLTNFPIHPDQLIAIGYGEERLKDLSDPYGALNRRVEVINLGRHKEAQSRQ